MALVSQTFTGSPELKKEGFYLLQKWYRLTNAQKHYIIKEILADGLNSLTPGDEIKERLRRAINHFIDDSEIDKLRY